MPHFFFPIEGNGPNDPVICGNGEDDDDRTVMLLRLINPSLNLSF